MVHISYQDTPNQLDIIREHGTRCHWTSFSVLNQVCTPQCDHSPPLPADDMRRFSPTDNKEGSSNQTLGSVDHPHHCAISENQLRRSLPPTLPTLSLLTRLQPCFQICFPICFQFVLIQVFPTALNNRFRHRFQNTAMSPTFRRSQVIEYRDRYCSHRELSRQSTSSSGQIANARPFLATNQDLVRDIPIPSATLSAPITRRCLQRTKDKNSGTPLAIAKF